MELTKRARRFMVFVLTQATQRAQITAEAAILLSANTARSRPSLIHSRVDYATLTDGWRA